MKTDTTAKVLAPLRTAASLSLCLFALTLAGCGGPSALKLVPVTGKISVVGKPLPTGSVSFRPDAARGNTSQHHPTGTLDDEGQYNLFTAGQKGAPPGWYKVVVFAQEADGPGGGVHPGIPTWLVNAKYCSDRTTDLVVEVVEKPGPGAYDFALDK